MPGHDRQEFLALLIALSISIPGFVGGGFTQPTNRIAQRLDMGWNVSAGAGVNATHHFGVMLDFTFNDMPVNGTSNVRDGVVYASPKTAGERQETASVCVRKLGLKIPALVDGIANGTERAYTGWPDRLYLIRRGGKVLYKSEPGPFGFHPAELEEAIKKL
jgi:type I thyroxine 5'-deiodinase